MRKELLDNAKSSEEKIFLSKLFDKAVLCQKYHGREYSNFLTIYEQSLVKRLNRYFDGVNIFFWGGYRDAERTMACFADDFSDEEQYEGFPIAVVKLSYSGQELSHRDFLGSILSLGINRDRIGDIVIAPDSGYVICSREIADYILYNIKKIGRCAVKAQTVLLNDIPVPEKKVSEIKGTVASLRLDSVVGLAIGKSRGNSAGLIRGGNVSVNWETIVDTDTQLKEGANISIRGYGRMVLKQIGGLTKKGRVPVVILKYL